MTAMYDGSGRMAQRSVAGELIRFAPVALKMIAGVCLLYLMSTRLGMFVHRVATFFV